MVVLEKKHIISVTAPTTADVAFAKKAFFDEFDEEFWVKGYHEASFTASCATRSGRIASNFAYKALDVRPLIIFEDWWGLLIGEQVEFNGEKFAVISKNKDKTLALSLKAIGKSPYFTDDLYFEDIEYEDTDLCQYIEKWFKE